MPRAHAPKAAPAPPGSAAGIVVRLAKPIPPVAPAGIASPGPRPPEQPGVCIGRCGHCHVHPCQLHASV